MIILFVDPHKAFHTAAAVDTPATTTIDTLTISSPETEYRRLLDWARRWPERYWAIENVEGLAHHLARWLISRGETVVDIPRSLPRRSAHVSHGGRRKNDPIDAAAAACVAAIRGESRALSSDPTGDDSLQSWRSGPSKPTSRPRSDR
ncbi:transposase [Nocardia africana]|uniref:Transposase n=1 Tax=Nocardia africana TaxID=134964 RepID=A0ABW6NCP6_9NOCA